LATGAEFGLDEEAETQVQDALWTCHLHLGEPMRMKYMDFEHEEGQSGLASSEFQGSFTLLNNY
jgi:hypothetical protein